MGKNILMTGATLIFENATKRELNFTARGNRSSVAKIRNIIKAKHGAKVVLMHWHETEEEGES